MKVGTGMVRQLVSALFVATLFLAWLALPAAAASGKDLVYVGTYTDLGSKGIYVFRFDPATGEPGPVDLAAETEQPSFLAVSENGRFLYSTNETNQFLGQKTGGASAFAIDPSTGNLKLLNQVSSMGAGPAHIAIDPSGHNVLLSNYGGGSVAVYRIAADGKLGENTAFIQHKGSSINHERQEGPHAHFIAFPPDNRFAVVADLGLDQVIAYPFQSWKGTLNGLPRISKSELGAGPRHLVFDGTGRFVYVINELHSTVTANRYDAASGGLTPLQTLSTLPKGFTGKNTAAEVALHPSGKFLYASNRGSDSIAVFAVDVAKGTLAPIEVVPTNGKKPRNFTFDPSGAWLLVGNQDSNTIVIFRVDPKTGRLTPTGKTVQVPTPACVLFVPET